MNLRIAALYWFIIPTLFSLPTEFFDRISCLYKDDIVGVISTEYLGKTEKELESKFGSPYQVLRDVRQANEDMYVYLFEHVDGTVVVNFITLNDKVTVMSQWGPLRATREEGLSDFSFVVNALKKIAGEPVEHREDTYLWIKKSPPCRIVVKFFSERATGHYPHFAICSPEGWSQLEHMLNQL